MPSPVAHATMGYVIYEICRRYLSDQAWARIGPVHPLLIATVGLSLVPDVDVLLGILMGDLNRFHNNVMNSLVVGLVVALGIGSVIWLSKRSGFCPDCCWVNCAQAEKSRRRVP